MGQECESVGDTVTCPIHPAQTSGRCRCLADTECPLGQVCRLTAPYPGLCEPSTAMDCAGMFVDMPGCPEFCSY
jgi:hypothetical protein